MKNYHVFRYVNGNWCVDWEFTTLEDAKAFFDAKVSELPVYRKRKNQQAFKKLHDTECWGYELDIEETDTNEYEVLDSDCMSWKEAKKAK